MREFFITILAFLICCTSKMSYQNENTLDIQGHRGYRGLYPENTIPGFIKALEIGCTTLELDVVITGDQEVLVSHEAFFNHKITTLPDGNLIKQEDEKNYNIYKMKMSEIRKFDVGLKPHPNFPKQLKIKISKPTLNEVFAACEKYINDNKLKKVHYNIEIKYLDENYNPPPTKFVSLVLDVIKKNKLLSRSNIQSFNHEVLNETHKQFPKMKIALLVGDTLEINHHLSQLNFKPDIYSPNYELVDDKMVETLRSKGIKIIPWTVNDLSNIKKMINFNVDGIITDYPDILIQALKN